MKQSHCHVSRRSQNTAGFNSNNSVELKWTICNNMRACINRCIELETSRLYPLKFNWFFLFVPRETFEWKCTLHSFQCPKRVRFDWNRKAIMSCSFSKWIVLSCQHIQSPAPGSFEFLSIPKNFYLTCHFN